MTTILFHAAAQVATSTVGSLLTGGAEPRRREGARLEELSVQSSTYGKFIPIAYGNVRLSGNVIWALPMKEVATTTTTTQGKGGGQAVSSSTDYSYFATLAIAVCEGEVDAIERVWADAKQLDFSLGTYRFYRGTEDQLPDSLIESYEGTGQTPAYRGLCYVVIEDFPLAEYGNRIPNFTFEVRKKVEWPDVGTYPIEQLVKEMVLIPGSGEFVYDTQTQRKMEGALIDGEYVQSGEQVLLNQHTPQGKANALVALDQLEESCPNLEWVALVVNWFATSMDITQCRVMPGIEYGSDQATTQPEVWSVANYTRMNAHPIAYVGDSPRYGGTPDDQSVLRLCDELIARGKKILFLPLFLMDTEGKPWRGRLTGTPAQISNFFTKAEGYNAYVLHYANLLKNKIDAFAIGSEMRGITEVHNGASINRQFPGVSQLVSLAATVKGIVGSGIKVTYAADWSEYHHTDGGWYHMDPLWASPNIDLVGIDAYFPLTDAPQSTYGYNVGIIQAGWTSGEGYDWYYSDDERTNKVNLTAPFAWKNIQWFWENNHTNPDGNSTAWVPQSKKIWFTEFGFPSVDGATNQPNVFYDPSSTESVYPYYSRGRVDFRAQRAGIAATLAQWADSPMVEKLFLWTWDARPYPYWPDLLSVWADGGVWASGHWVQGKFGLSALAAIVAELCQRAGLDVTLLDVTRLDDQIDGLVLNRHETARHWLETLMSAYFIDAAETDGRMKFVPRGSASAASVEADALVGQSDRPGEILHIERQQELELPKRIEVNYLNRLSLYQTATQASQRQIADSVETEALNLPIVMDGQRARVIADVELFQRWMGRIRYQLEVGNAFADIEPTDVITVTDRSNAQHVMRVTRVRFGRPGRMQIEAVAEEAASYDFFAPPATAPIISEPLVSLIETQARLLDLPALPGDGANDSFLRIAASGLASGWPGAVLYRSDDGGSNYGELARMLRPAVMGTAATALPEGPTNRFDETSHVEVVLLGQSELVAVSEQALLNGANLALLGDEIIQFQAATLLAPHHYRLSRLLRGRLGSEHAIASHTAGESFVLLNTAIHRASVADGLFGLARDYKAVSIGKTLGSVASKSFTYLAKALKPYAPVHVTGMRDALGNLTIGWVRRTRIGGHWRDGTDVPLSEASEHYAVEVYDGNDIIRTIEVSVPEALYSAADQASDFGVVQSQLTVRIYQLSAQIGRGYYQEAIL